MSRRLALLIGNVHYQDGRLHTPVSGKTFTALADALEAPTAGGFDEVFVSVNKPAVEVQLTIAEFLELSQAADDVLLLYFAGHALVHQGRPYLACADTFTASYLDATTVQADYVRRRFAAHPSRHKLVVLDCSTSAVLSSDVLPEDESWLGQIFQAAGVQVVAAARPFIPDAPANSTLTPAMVAALRAGQVRLNVAGLAAAVARLNEIAAPPAVAAPATEPSAAEAESPVTETETPVTEAEVPPATTEETPVTTEEAVVAVVIPAETSAVDETAAAAETPPAAESEPVAEIESEEDEGVEPTLLVRVDEAEVTPPPRQFPRRYALAGVVILLLFLVVGGLYRGGLLLPTAVAPAPTPTTAVALNLPTDAPTPLPTRTAVPTNTPTNTGQETPTATGTAVTATSSPSPTPSPTPAVTLSPTAVGVSVARQLVFMRSGPAINFRIVEYLTQGTAVTVLGRTESGEWYNVQLADGRTGWVFSEMVAPPTAGEMPDIPLVGTIPAPANEFYNFVAQPTDDGLTLTVGHVYVGTAGPEGLLEVTLLPETDLIQPDYESGQALGLGDFVVHLARVGEGEYVSTAVQLCMVSPAGAEFYCEMFPLRREW